jgi:hypothetical protein
MDEHGEHRDLHGLDRRSIIPYVHGRDECCIVVCLIKSGLSLPNKSMGILMSTQPFIAQGLGIYIETQGLTGGPGIVTTLHDKTLLDRSSK